jgi:hypothetical protein
MLVKPKLSAPNLILFSLLILFLLQAQALATSIAMAYSDLNWASATFSGPVAPASIPNPYSTLTEVGGTNLTSNSFTGSTDLPAGWVPAASTVQLGPEDYAIAAANTDLSAVSVDAGNYLLYAQTERSGSIVSENGTVSISIPYSLSVTAVNDPTSSCCFTAITQVWIDLFNAAGNQPFGGVGVDYVDAFGAVSNYSDEGVLSLNLSGLQAGTSYWFDVGAASQTVDATEPSSFVLMLVGLLACAFAVKTVLRSISLG